MTDPESQLPNLVTVRWSTVLCVCGGGDTLMFSYIGRLRSFWFKILNFNTLGGGVRKMNIFFFFGGGGGYDVFVDLFWGSS